VQLTAVFDTNIVLSAIGWKGKPFECLELARNGVVHGLTCAAALDELSLKLESKLLFTPEESTDAIIDLLTFLRVVQVTGRFAAVAADHDDDKIIECAVLGGATHIVTGDRRHLLPLKSFQRIEIVTAAEFLVAAARS
jgi:uncharacterized protein